MRTVKTISEIAKEAAEKAMQEITINGMSISKFVENLNNAAESDKCHLESCRYNRNGICQNREKRKECVHVAKLVLCLGDE